MKVLANRLLQTSTLIGVLNIGFALLLLTPGGRATVTSQQLLSSELYYVIIVVAIIFGSYYVVANHPRYDLLFIAPLATSVYTITTMFAGLQGLLSSFPPPHFYLIYSSWTFFQLLIIYYYGTGRIK